MAGQDFDALKKQATHARLQAGAARAQGVAGASRTRCARSTRATSSPSSKAAIRSSRTNTSSTTAHWDHFGIGAPVNGDKIYNGALDNASGVASVLEIARAFTQVKPAPKRSILFLAVTAEEQGLLGSQYYAVTPVYPLAKTAREHQHRRHQPVGPHQGHHGHRARRSDLDDYLRDAAAEQSRTLRPDPEPEKGFYYRSDHFNFAKQGVPALDPTTGIEYIGKPPEYGKTEARRIHGASTTTRRRTRSSPTGIWRRRGGRGAAVRRRLPRRATPTSSPSGSRATSSRRSGTRCCASNPESRLPASFQLSASSRQLKSFLI